MDAPSPNRLLAFARELQRAATFEELLVATQAEIATAVGYTQAWLFVAEAEDCEEMRLLAFAGSKRELAWDVAPVLKVRGDAMLEEIVRGDEPVVVDEARTDPRTNKEIVARVGNRTIINIPLRLLDKPFGAVGTGTFGEEGCRPPTREHLDYLVGMAGQLAVAAGRIRFLEERRRAAETLRKTEEQLRQAQKMDAIGRLAGGIAHDFNNLLSVVLSYTGLLLMRLPESDPSRVEIEEIKKAGERASVLTSQLLSFSRHQIVEPRILDLGEVILGMDTMIRRVIGEDIVLSVRVVPGLGRVRADRGHVEQVILNLVVNARDAMPGGGSLALEAMNAELDDTYAREHVGVAPGPHVALAVGDTGVGMDKATRERIFEPFFTTKEQGRGTGLGLSTVYGIVQQSGGNVWVYSEPGKGTTFKIYFPRTNETGVPETPEPLPVRTLRGSETVLLVEDDDALRSVARTVLDTHGYRVLEARDGEEASLVGSTFAGTIDLLLTDVVMPKLGGRELADRLTAMRPALRVLFMSGYTESAIAHRRALSPGVVVLEKPVTPDLLLRRVREALELRA